MRSFSILVAAGAVFAGRCLAEEVSIPATSAQLVTVNEGSQIVIAMARPEILEHVSLGEARLQLVEPMTSDESELRIQILALRAPYAGGGEPQVHEGLVGRLSIEAGSRAQVVDLSNLVRGVLHETEFYGLLVTTSAGVHGGFDQAAAQAILSALQGATLEISYRRMPPPRPQRSS